MYMSLFIYACDSIRNHFGSQRGPSVLDIIACRPFYRSSYALGSDPRTLLQRKCRKAERTLTSLSVIHTEHSSVFLTFVDYGVRFQPNDTEQEQLHLLRAFRRLAGAIAPTHSTDIPNPIRGQDIPYPSSAQYATQRTSSFTRYLSP